MSNVLPKIALLQIELQDKFLEESQSFKKVESLAGDGSFTALLLTIFKIGWIVVIND